jgi:quercetin dioxygenase-like cupin family protein
MKYRPAMNGEWLQCAGYAKKILLTEGDLAQKGALVQLIKIPPHTSTAKHFHEHCTEVFHVINGNGTFLIEGKTIKMNLGDTLTCEPREIHRAENHGDEPLVYVVFKTNAVADDIHWV